MTIGLLKEPQPETRVSLLPEAVATLTKKGITLLVENGAGLQAAASDTAYEQAGARISSREEIIQSADLLLSIHPASDVNKKGTIQVGIYQPLYNNSLVQEWCDLQQTVFSMDMLPRTTRAQSMDVLSSQANIAGYKAVLLAANLYPRYLPMFMTAAGQYCTCKDIDTGSWCCRLTGYCYGKAFGCCC
jgi:NAD(P) transhydrogenase subunit alpha